jgi:hypothetical protein
MQNVNENKSIGREDVASEEPSVANYYVGIGADILLLYFFNNIKFVEIPFLTTKDYVGCLWAINLALGMGIIGNFILLLYRPRWFPHLVQAILNALSIFAVYIIYKIFPFSFSNSNFQTAARIALIVIMAAIAIGLVNEVIKFGKTWMHREPPPIPPVSPVPPLPPEPPQPPTA